MKFKHHMPSSKFQQHELTHMQEIINQSKEIPMSDIENGQLIAQELKSEGAFALQNQETYQLFTEQWIVPEERIQTVYNEIGYTHLANNASADVTNDASIADPQAEEIAPVSDSGSGKMPWIVGGSGLLLAGLAAAAAGGSSGGGDSSAKSENTAKKRIVSEESSAQQPTESSKIRENETTAVAPATELPAAPVEDNHSDTEPDNTQQTEEENKTAGAAQAATESSAPVEEVQPVEEVSETPKTEIQETPAPTPERTEEPAPIVKDAEPSQEAAADPGQNINQPAEASPEQDHAADQPATTEPKQATEAAPEISEPATEPTAPTKENVAPENTEINNEIIERNQQESHTQAEPAPQPAVNGKQSGLTLDIAKHFYSADVIKKYIDTISKSGGTFLQLHLSDDDNYAFESTVLNQRAADAIHNEDGTYTNPKTGKQFLSYEQIADIVSHAKAKGVELIPEVDTPNHMDAIFDLLTLHKGEAYVKSIKSEMVNDEIKITDPKAVDFVKSLYSEVIGLMQGNSKHFHIGGDEFGYSALSNHEFITYANNLSEFLEDKGLKTRMWNDGLLKTSLKDLNPAIEITYWSYDGNPGVDSVAADRRAERASMKDLLDEGFDVLNYNWYYLYFVPDEGVTNAESGAHMASDIQATWNLDIWDGQDHSNKLSDTGKVIGSSLTIWGENADNLTDDEIYEWSANGLAALISKTNAESIDKESLSKVSLDITKEIRDNGVINLKSSASELVDVSLADDLLSSYSFVWLNGDTDDMLTLSSDWSFSGASEYKDNVSYSLYKQGNNHLYVDTDMPVEIL